MDDGFRALIRRADDGCEKAIWELVERASPYVYRVVRRRMLPSLRARYESVDFVQMAWTSLLLRERRLSQFETEQQLLGFLAGIAVNKVRMGARKTLQRPTQDARREVPIDEAVDVPTNRNEPTPSHVIAFRDAWEHHLDRQPPHYREIIHRKLNGETCQQIASDMNLNERTVRRVLKKLCNEVAA